MGGWQTARESYHAGEFAAARDRLRALVPEGPQSLEAARYLAAAHYRLGEYGAAAEVLRQARHDFPTEIGLVPQYARTLERAGQPEDARRQWEALLALDPGNRAALQGLRRLSTPRGSRSKTPGDHEDYDSQMGLPAVEPCPRCGAHNRPTDRRCWRCGHERTQTRRFTLAWRMPEAWAWVPEALVFGTALLLTAVLIVVGLPAPVFEPAPSSAAAVRQLLQQELRGLRMALGWALVAVWPLLLAWLARSRRQVQPRNTRKGLAGGFLLGSAAAVGLWAPLGQWPRLALALAALALCVQAWSGPRRLKAFVYGGLAQAVAVVAIGGAAALSTVGWRFLSEFDVIAAYARQAQADQAAPAMRFEGTLPLLTWVRWKSTGSRWLDAHAHSAHFVVQAGEAAPLGRIRILRGLETIAEDPPDTADSSIRIAHPVPGARHEIAAEGPVGTSVSIQVICPLPFERGEVIHDTL